MFLAMGATVGAERIRGALERRRRSWQLRLALFGALRSTGPWALVRYAVVWTLGIAFPLATPLATGAVIGLVPAAVGEGLGSIAGRRLTAALAVLAVVFIGQRLTEAVSGIVAKDVALRVDAAVQERLMDAASAPPGIEHLEDDGIRSRLALGAGPTGRVALSVPQLAARYVGAVGGVAIIARSSLLVAALVFVLFLRERFFWRAKFLQMADAGGRTAAEVQRADYYADLLLRPSAAKETRIFGLSNWKARRFSEQWWTAQQPRWAWFDDYVRSFVVGFPLRFIAYAVPYGLLADLAVSGRIGLGAFIAGAQATMHVLGLSAIAYEDLTLAGQAHAYPEAQRIEAELQAIPRRNGIEIGPPTTGVRFERVSFAYPGRETPVLHDLDLALPAGRSTAIVGVNGAGKTTLVKLLAGLYTPTAGRVVVDGRDLASIDPTSWRRQLAVVFQDFARYQATAADNIAFGSPEHLRDLAEIGRAAEHADIERILSALPGSWETMLSREFPGGAELSGGQWQRVAIARALFAVHQGASVLVLDEPTANLDVRAEADLFGRLLEVTDGVTTVLISHRFSTVRRADAIAVVDSGRVIERGTHEELLRLGGSYARMFRLQADRFGATTVGDPG